MVKEAERTDMAAHASLLPKEHGAYGQIAFPLATAFLVAGVSAAGLLVAVAVTAGFLAHEPAAVLLGLRGVRARRELGTRAARWLALCLAALVAAGLGALVTIDAEARAVLAIPFVPAVVLAVATLRGRDKSWYGEVAACAAFSGAAVPVAVAGGASPQAAATIAIPFALLFATSTLAVRVVILRVRGGGDAHATAATRRALFALTAAAIAALGAAMAIEILDAVAFAASAPGLLTAAAVAARPPAPARLRHLGWTLVGVSLLTALVIVAGAPA
jgi:hypothetical protein